MRFVIDTNTLISMAITHNSVSGQAVRLAFEIGIVIASNYTLDEFESVLMRDKFERFSTLANRKQFILDIRAQSQMIEIKTTVRECRDPNDDMFLELAVNGRANCIISGDKDLQVLHPFRGISILSSRDFLVQFGEE